MAGCRTTPIRSLFELAEARHVPLNMMLELTYRCNERCLHCYLPETQGARDPRAADELTFEEWSRVLGELAEAGTLYVIFTGGEVLLRHDLGRILARARELAFSVEVFTNATLLTPEIADEWVRERRLSRALAFPSTAPRPSRTTASPA
jgi:MoaA/NifB/PqqE/SkfB family radical SAM enzyme